MLNIYIYIYIYIYILGDENLTIFKSGTMYKTLYFSGKLICISQ